MKQSLLAQQCNRCFHRRMAINNQRAENAKGTDALVEARESVGRVLRVAISCCVRESVEVTRVLEFWRSCRLCLTVAY
jgi:hypothetical protein